METENLAEGRRSQIGEGTRVVIDVTPLVQDVRQWTRLAQELEELKNSVGELRNLLAERLLSLEVGINTIKSRLG